MKLHSQDGPFQMYDGLRGPHGAEGMTRKGHRLMVIWHSLGSRCKLRSPQEGTWEVEVLGTEEGLNSWSSICCDNSHCGMGGEAKINVFDCISLGNTRIE